MSDAGSGLPTDRETQQLGFSTGVNTQADFLLLLFQYCVVR